MVEYIEFQKVSKASTTAVELQAGLLQDGICRDENLPSKSTMETLYVRTYDIHIRNYTGPRRIANRSKSNLHLKLYNANEQT